MQCCWRWDHLEYPVKPAATTTRKCTDGLMNDQFSTKGCLTSCSAPTETFNLTMIWLSEGSSLFRIIIWPLTLSHYLRQQSSLTSKCVTVEQWLQVVLNHLNKLTSELWFFESINSKKIQFFERRSHMMVLICSSFNYNAVLKKSIILIISTSYFG